MSAIEGDALFHKKYPGPQHKYNLKYLELCRPKTPIYVNLSKSVGRDNKTKNSTSVTSVKKNEGRKLGP